MKTTILIAAIAVLGLVGCTDAKKRHHGALHNQDSPVRQTTDKEKLAGAPISPGKVTYLADPDFRCLIMDYVAHPREWVYRGNRPAIIDFYATWCGPCKMMTPIVDAMARAYAGKVDFYKVDIDKERQLAATLGIQSIPTFLFVPASGNPTLLTGAMQRVEFEKAMRDILFK